MQRTGKDEYAHQDTDDLNLWAFADTLYAQWESILLGLRARNEQSSLGTPGYSAEEREALQTLVANMDALISGIRGSRRKKLIELRGNIVAELCKNADFSASLKEDCFNRFEDSETPGFTAA